MRFSTFCLFTFDYYFIAYFTLIFYVFLPLLLTILRLCQCFLRGSPLYREQRWLWLPGCRPVAPGWRFRVSPCLHWVPCVGAPGGRGRSAALCTDGSRWCYSPGSSIPSLMSVLLVFVCTRVCMCVCYMCGEWGGV